jgi:hypothetical protein
VVGILLIAIGGLLSLASTVAAIIILIHAFQDEVWKGVLGLVCSLYLIYYAFAEYQADNKWTIIAVWLAAGTIGGALLQGGMTTMIPERMDGLGNL